MKWKNGKTKTVFSLYREASSDKIHESFNVGEPKSPVGSENWTLGNFKSFFVSWKSSQYTTYWEAENPSSRLDFSSASV